MYWNSTAGVSSAVVSGLIETWDVLKFAPSTLDDFLCDLINRNMRCIEIGILHGGGKMIA